MVVDFNPCESLHAYFFQELGAEEARAFELHVRACAGCREQLEELKWLWRELPFAAEAYDPPAGLKADVLRAVFGDADDAANDAGGVSAGSEASERAGDGAGVSAGSGDEAEPRRTDGPAAAAAPGRTRSFTYAGLPPRRRTWRRWAAASAAGLVLLAGGFAAGLAVGRLPAGSRLAEPAASASPGAVQQPWSLQREVALRAVNPALQGGEGSVWLLRQNGATQVVLRVSGLPATQGGESYQMWMVRSGKRWSCGTFQVDPSGTGVLLYQMKSEAGFDSIGITLEPDASGKQPRGPKVLGS